MGVVKRQGIKQSIVTYLGVVIGLVNIMVIYPAVLEREELGIIVYVRDTAAMLSLFLFLGSGELIVRFFPFFKNEEKKHHGFLVLLLAILSVGSLLFIGIYLLLKGELTGFFAEKSPLHLQFYHFILPLTVIIAFGTLFGAYATNFQRIVVPAIFAEFIPKVGLPVLVLAYFYGLIDFNLIFLGLLGIFSLVMIGTIGYVAWLGQLNLKPDFNFLKKPLVKSMASYSVYGFFGGLGSRFSSDFIGVFMVGTISTLTNTGIFSIAYLISNVIDVPRKAISRISSPLLADKWKEGKVAEIEEMYHKSSLNQLIVGLWLFLVIWISIDEIFQIMPNGEKYASGKYVVFILGLARVIDMATGVNSEIISFSKYYRYNFFLILLMAAVHITANLVLIPELQIIGAALATFISIFLFNFFKFLVLKLKLNMQPFSRQTLWVLLFAGIAYGAALLMPSLQIPIFDAAIGSALFTVIFVGLSLMFKVSPDINQLVNKTFLLVKNRL